MKRFFFQFVFLTLPLIAICQVSPIKDLNTNFMVFSDPHYYDPSLGTEGEAFQNYLDQDRKLLRESRSLMLESIKLINSKNVDFVLIPGDLTKDGTKVSHEEFAKLLSRIEANNTKVFVVPGNHDVSNGEANKFEGDSTYLVDDVDPAEFREIYAKYAYDEAIYSDENSLSYVAEPVEGLWILGLDACLYRGNQPGHHPHTSGAFKVETLEWIDEIAEIAKKENKQMMAMMHHGILEHYKGQKKYFGEYVVNDYKAVSQRLANHGISIVFTGHYHAQDITRKEWKDGSFLYDVETGSLVTYPCPVRHIQINDGHMDIRSSYIESIIEHPDGFTQYGKEYVHSGISGIAEETLVDYKLEREDAHNLSGQIADAFIAHYRGDEIIPEKYIDTKGVGLFGKIVILVKKKMIVGLYNDLEPADSEIQINLETGAWKLPNEE